MVLDTNAYANFQIIDFYLTNGADYVTIPYFNTTHGQVPFSFSQPILWVNGGWLRFLFSEVNQLIYFRLQNGTFTNQITFTITDYFCKGDSFDLIINGVTVARTPNSDLDGPDGCETYISNPNKAMGLSSYGTIRFTQSFMAGASVIIRVRRSPYGGGRASIRVDEVGDICFSEETVLFHPDNVNGDGQGNCAPPGVSYTTAVGGSRPTTSGSITTSSATTVTSIDRSSTLFWTTTFTISTTKTTSTVFAISINNQLANSSSTTSVSLKTTTSASTKSSSIAIINNLPGLLTSNTTVKTSTQNTQTLNTKTTAHENDTNDNTKTKDSKTTANENDSHDNTKTKETKTTAHENDSNDTTKTKETKTTAHENDSNDNTKTKDTKTTANENDSNDNSKTKETKTTANENDSNDNTKTKETTTTAHENDSNDNTRTKDTKTPAHENDSHESTKTKVESENDLSTKTTKTSENISQISTAKQTENTSTMHVESKSSDVTKTKETKVLKNAANIEEAVDIIPPMTFMTTTITESNRIKNAIKSFSLLRH